MANPKMKILFADDDDAFRNVMTMVLHEDPNFEVTGVGSGEEAIEALKSNTFEVIVLDYKMGEVSGLNVMQWIHEQKIDTPVIMLTSAGNEMVAVEAMKLGAYDYVRKENIELHHFQTLINGVYERFMFRQERREIERIKTRREKNLAALDMYHDTASSFGQVLNNSMTVFSIKMEEYSQELLPYVKEEGKKIFTDAFNDLRQELAVIASGFRSVVDLARMVTKPTSAARDLEAGLPHIEMPKDMEQQSEEQKKDSQDSAV
jgi:CheY-like chemotaxis protein